MSHKKILTYCIFLFVLVTLFLFMENSKELDPNEGKDWWTLSLTSPDHEESLSFAVDNHSTKTDFSYEIMVGKNTITKESFLAEKTKRTVINPPLLRKQSERVKIIVTTGDEKKELYR